MNLTIENILLVGSLLLFVSIIVGKTSYKFGVPTLLLFLAIGMLAGSDGIGGNGFLAIYICAVSLGLVCEVPFPLYLQHIRFWQV